MASSEVLASVWLWERPALHAQHPGHAPLPSRCPGSVGTWELASLASRCRPDEKSENLLQEVLVSRNYKGFLFAAKLGVVRSSGEEENRQALLALRGQGVSGERLPLIFALWACLSFQKAQPHLLVHTTVLMTSSPCVRDVTGTLLSYSFCLPLGLSLSPTTGPQHQRHLGLSGKAYRL